MGCINSTKKLNEFRNDNVFRVRALRLKPPDGRVGYLELSPSELTFFVQDRDPVIWALQHLRRYGLNDDIFCFEAGRRCMSGPGIYTFRCYQNADKLYQLFQRYVNAVSSRAFNFPDINQEIHPSHILGRPENNTHTNNYLEPAPATNVIHRPSIPLNSSVTMVESFSSSPLSLDLHTPDSMPSLSFTTEFANLANQLNQPSTPGTYVNTINTNTNVYLEHPLRSQALEFNNNTSTCSGSGGGAGVVGGGSGSVPSSAFSTLNRKTILKHSSLDVPPEEAAPILRGAENSLHLYANVETFPIIIKDTNRILNPPERCYENLDRLNFPLFIKPSVQQQKMPNTSIGSLEDKQLISNSQQQEPTTPISPNAGMNYIVLDLDHQPKTTQRARRTRFGSRLSLTMDRTDVTNDLQMPMPLGSSSAKSTLSVTTNTIPRRPEGLNFKIASSQPLTEESSLSYSTIDFIKTYALKKSKTPEADMDGDNETDQEELRVTRHSKCVRKAYSISE